MSFRLLENPVKKRKRLIWPSFLADNTNSFALTNSFKTFLTVNSLCVTDKSIVLTLKTVFYISFFFNYYEKLCFCLTNENGNRLLMKG